MAEQPTPQAPKAGKTGFKLKKDRQFTSVTIGGASLSISLKDLENEKVVKMLRAAKVFDLIAEPA